MSETSDLRRASNGAVIHLGQVLGRGGEGAVHAIVGAPRQVAKIYTKLPAPAKAEKLRLMARRHTRELLNAAAWPTDVLVDARGVTRGFVMDRIASRKDAHHLYSPKSRRNIFPDADFRFLVRAAANLARAFAQVHALGHVIGDVNHGNALIGADGTAVLIDCDSFQVTEHGRTFTCDVGSPLFTAPELQGQAFRGLKRAADHDSFGLAVLLFHLLFQGRHPFAGTHPEDISVERAIAERRFVYGSERTRRGSEPPPGALSLDTFGGEIADLFERAFAGFEPRPSATEWIEPLMRLENSLVACAQRPRHYHPPDAPCCWCEVEARTGARPFDSSIAPAAADKPALTVEELWQAIQKVPAPPQGWALPDVIVADEHRYRRRTRIDNGLVGILFGALPVLSLFVLVKFAAQMSGYAIMATLVAVFAGAPVFSAWWKRQTEKRRRYWRGFRNLLDRWRAETSVSSFDKLRGKLLESRRDLKVLMGERQASLDKLMNRLRPGQRERYLESLEIDSATLLQLSDDDRARLRANGVRSAADVLRLRRKIGKVVSAPVNVELRQWASHCEARFQFDAQHPEFLARARPIENEYERRIMALRGQLERGPRELEARKREILSARERANGRLVAAHRKLREETR